MSNDQLSQFCRQGFGMSAAIVKPPEQPGPDRHGFWPPVFHIPFPRRVNPEMERARAHGLAWSRSRNLVSDDATEERLDSFRFDRNAAYVYPDARGAGLEVATEWLYWGFQFDDLFDGPLGRQPGKVRQIVDPMIRYIHGDPSGIQRDAMPLVQAFAELCDRAGWGRSRAWRARFAEEMSNCIFSYYFEAFHHIRGGTDDLDTFTDVRRYTIGILPSLDFGETAGSYEVAEALVRTEPFHRLRTIACDVSACVNEAFSLGKDLAYGETSSGAVVLMRSRGWSPEQVIHFLEDSVSELVDQYLALERYARTLPERLGMPEEEANVRRYLQLMRDSMVGNHDWSAETVRYSDHVPDSWRGASPLS